MTLNELANSQAIQWGLENDFATVERIKLHAISGRATTIQRRYDTTKIFPQSLILTLKCQDVIRVTDDECDCFHGCGFVFRSLNKIPRPLIVKDDSYFIFVGNPKGFISYSYLRPEEVQDIKQRKFSEHQMFYTYTNDYLYFLQMTSEFLARYVPENPLEVMKIGTCNGGGCLDNGDLELEQSIEEGIWAFLKDKRPIILEEARQEVIINGND